MRDLRKIEEFCRAPNTKRSQRWAMNLGTFRGMSTLQHGKGVVVLSWEKEEGVFDCMYFSNVIEHHPQPFQCGWFVGAVVVL